MATTGWKFPSANSQYAARASTYCPIWANPANLYANDGTNGTSNGNDTFDGAGEKRLFSGFGFTTSDIPSGATIDGIEVRFEASGDSTTNGVEQKHYLYTQLAVSGSVVGASNNEEAATTITEYTEGGAANMWGSSLTDANIRDASFGVVLWVDGPRTFNYADNIECSVDYVSIRVTYTAAAGGPTGTAAPSLPVPQASASGVRTVTGAAAPGLPMLTAASTGRRAISGAAAPSLPVPQTSATGVRTITASAAPVLPVPTAAAAGSRAITGAGGPGLPALTAASAGVRAITGAAAPGLPVPQASATGVRTITGSGAAALPALTAFGAGSVGGEISAAAAVTLPALAGAGAAVRTVVGVAAAVLPQLAAAAAAARTIFATAAPALPLPTASAVAKRALLATAAAILPALATSATGIRAIIGSGAATLPGVTGAGTASRAVTGAAAPSLPLPQTTASGVRRITGSVGGALPAMTASGDGDTVGAFGATAAVVVPALAGSAVGVRTIIGAAAGTLPILTASAFRRGVTWASMINDEASGEVPLVLAVLDNAGWAGPLRLVGNTEDIVSNGDTYTAAGLEIAMPDQVEGRNGDLRFTLVDADATTLATIRQTAGIIDVTISWVLASDPDTAYAGPIDAEIRETEGAFGYISGALTAYPVLAENAVAQTRFRFNSVDWPGVL